MAGVLVSTLKLADKTSGRDRLCRLVQYGTKLLSWLLDEAALRPELVPLLHELEASISTARKLFRLGKSLDQFRGALQTIHLSDPLLRMLTTLAKLSRGFYLLLDHLIWASRMRLITIDSGYWTRLSNRFWLFALLLCLLRDAYEAITAVDNERRRSREYARSSGSAVSPRGSMLGRAARNHPALCIDLVKNSFDVIIPVARLELVSVSSGVVGLAGVVSSLAGLVQVWSEGLKLKFS